MTEPTYDTVRGDAQAAADARARADAIVDSAIIDRQADELIAIYARVIDQLDPLVADKVRAKYDAHRGDHLARVAAADPAAPFHMAVSAAESVVKYDADPANRRAAARYLIANKSRTRG